MRRAVEPPGPELLLAGPAQILQLVAGSVAASLRGRRRTFVLGGNEVTAVLDDLTVATGMGLAVGQFDEVAVELSDLEWQGRRVSSLRLAGRNVHLRPGIRPTLVASPVAFEAVVAADDLASWVPSIVGRRVEIVIGDDAVARARWRDRPQLGAVEIEARVEGPILVLDPTTLVAGSRRFTALRRLPPLRLPLVTPRGVHVTDVAVEPGALRVGGHVTEWAEPLAVAEVQRFVRMLTPDLDPVVVPRTTR